MKSNFDKLVHPNVIIAFCLTAIGLLANQWVFEYLLPEGISWSLEGKIFVWAFQAFCIIIGLLFYFKGRTPEGRKRLVFTLIAIALMFVITEVVLQVTHLVINMGADDEIDQRAFLSPYEDKDWAQTLFTEFYEIPNEYEQFVGWARREYHGEYTNVSHQGFRETWNPEVFQSQVPDTIYIFGGSTIWGTGARDDYTIPSSLSKMLNGDNYDFFIYNYGETGYTFTQEIIRLILLLREGHRPEYVIFYDGINDVYGAYQSGMAGTTQNISIIREKLKSKTDGQLFWTGVTRIIKEYSMTYRAFNKISAGFSPKQLPQEVASKYSDQELRLLSEGVCEYYKRSMELIDNLSQAYDFEYICLWQPVMYTEKKLTDEETTIDPRLNDKTLAKIYRYTTDYLLAKSPPHFFIIADALRGRTKSCYIDICHLSEEGNEMIANEILRIFKNEALLNE